MVRTRLGRFLRCALLWVPFALAAAALGAQETKDKPREWKLSVAVGPAFALGKAGERWAKLVTERSDGAFAVVPSFGATLAQRDPVRELAALAAGAADLAVGSSLFWSMQAGALGVIGLPWLAPDPRQLDALVTG